MPIELKPVPDIVGRGGNNNRSLPDAATSSSRRVEDASPARVEAAALELPDFRTYVQRTDGSNWLEHPALYRVDAVEGSVQLVLLYER